MQNCNTRMTTSDSNGNRSEYHCFRFSTLWWWSYLTRNHQGPSVNWLAQLLFWTVDYEMEGSSEVTVPINEKVCKTLGSWNLEEDDDVMLRSLTVSEPNTSLANWHSSCHQLPLLELLNKWRNRKGKDGISKSSYQLSSISHLIAILHASDIMTITNWLEMVGLARANYEEPDSHIIHQSISQRN